MDSSSRIWSRRQVIRSIGRINTLFSLFHQEKKEIHDAFPALGYPKSELFPPISQDCSFPPVDPATISHRHADYLPLFFVRCYLVSWLSQTDLAGYPNKSSWGGALLSGNRLNSFDSAFLSRCASICLRACPSKTIVGEQDPWQCRVLYPTVRIVVASSPTEADRPL